MATVVWVSVFLLLVVEILITLLLVLPLPRTVRRFLARKIFTYDLSRRVRTVSNYILVGLIIAFADAINGLRHLEKKGESTTESVKNTYQDSQSNYFTSSVDKQRKFRIERNMYMSAFALTLGFVITRLVELIQELENCDEEIDHLKKRLSASLPSRDTSSESTTTTATEATNGNQPSGKPLGGIMPNLPEGLYDKLPSLRRRSNVDETKKSD